MINNNYDELYNLMPFFYFRILNFYVREPSLQYKYYRSENIKHVVQFLAKWRLYKQTGSEQITFLFLKSRSIPYLLIGVLY